MNKKGFTFLEGLLVLVCLSVIIGLTGFRNETKFERQNIQLATEQYLDCLEYSQLYAMYSKADVMVFSVVQAGETSIQFLSYGTSGQKLITKQTLPQDVKLRSSLLFTIQGRTGGLSPKVMYFDSGIYSVRISMLLGMGRVNVEEQMR